MTIHAPLGRDPQLSCNPLQLRIKQLRRVGPAPKTIRNQNSVPMPKFVVQEHHARTHHFDFRLEKDGVYKSWAVPKGVPEAPGVKRLAVQVEDHDLPYGDFQGNIPQGQYGAGEVRIWDKGSYESEEWTDTQIDFHLHGHQASGRFSLIRFQRGKPNEWLLLKRSDEHTPTSP
jgi:DNA ligase D-like protein (predicted 3'-phosphoesterase)